MSTGSGVTTGGEVDAAGISAAAADGRDGSAVEAVAPEMPLSNSHVFSSRK